MEKFAENVLVKVECHPESSKSLEREVEYEKGVKVFVVLIPVVLSGKAHQEKEACQ